MKNYFLTGNFDRLTQAIGDAAHFLGFDGQIVPSARWDCRNLVTITDGVALNDDWVAGAGDPIDWKAWRTQQMGNKSN